jgi:CheY-like chemotaxis protein
LPDEQLWADADAVRMAQIVGNLLNNAAKYTPEGGSIWVSAERADVELIIRVRDDGIGIAAEVLPQVFQLFTQADRSLDRAQGGLGIGLSLVKSLVEMHGGRAQAFSAGLGKGSEFVIRLPLLIEPQKAQLKEPDAARNVPVARRVLIVDDNEDSAQSMALLLGLEGHQVEVASEGSAAIELACKLHPEVVLLDIGLPGMDGYELARELRSTARVDHALSIALTGYGQADDRERSRQAGFHHHLVKPADLNDLTALIAAFQRAAPSPSR